MSAGNHRSTVAGSRQTDTAHGRRGMAAGPVKLFGNVSELVPCTSADPATILRGGALLVAEGRIVEVGTEADLDRRHPGAERVDCGGGVLTPGLVDSHTHAVFGRWRADEYALRARGVPYMEIARRGGGINASVRDLRERSEEELV
ncbi:MAG: hypothetical protein KY466_05120, partial [Gemmatimonadetes bacterium]|nr:hypothetical protein [Gemmatimonadota bacterium]